MFKCFSTLGSKPALSVSKWCLQFLSGAGQLSLLGGTHCVQEQIWICSGSPSWYPGYSSSTLWLVSWEKELSLASHCSLFNTQPKIARPISHLPNYFWANRSSWPGVQQNQIISKLKDLYRKTNIPFVSLHFEPVRNEMLLHILEMELLYIKKGVVYFSKMSLQFRSLNWGETNTLECIKMGLNFSDTT